MEILRTSFFYINNLETFVPSAYNLSTSKLFIETSTSYNVLHVIFESVSVVKIIFGNNGLNDNNLSEKVYYKIPLLLPLVKLV